MWALPLTARTQVLVQCERLDREGRWFQQQARVRTLNNAHVTGAAAREALHVTRFSQLRGRQLCELILALHGCELGVGQRPFLIFSLVSWLLFCCIMVADCVIFSLNTESKQARLYRVLTFI